MVAFYFGMTFSLRYMPFCLFFSVVIYLYLSILFDSTLWGKSFVVSSNQKPNFRGTLLLINPNSKVEIIAPSISTKDMIPEIIYGTAWKKERTAQLVEQAVRAGFRAIDTACQPKHYYEKGVGDALIKLTAEGIVKREDLFIQSKFTSLRGQDPRNIPYDRNAPLREQVMQSFAKSCENLRTNYLDSLVMHSPMDTIADTITVWRAFEEIHKRGGVKHLGLSNTYDLRVLQTVYEHAEIKPYFLQNRFYADSGYDVQIREYCRSHNIRYQSFWTLTGNPHILKA
ncbi:aldo/keto reductase [archaeon]|nr:MAG: aldo/keto reductase [archaeon]